MKKWVVPVAVLLLIGLGMTYGSTSASEKAENSAFAINEENSTNGCGNLSAICPNKENCSGTCACPGNATCTQSNCIYNNFTQVNCTYGNCLYVKSDAQNNSSSISCPTNGPCPIVEPSNLKPPSGQIKGRVFTLTISCNGCY